MPLRECSPLSYMKILGKRLLISIVSNLSIGGLAFQLFRTPFGATSSSGRDFDGRNLKNAQTKSEFSLIGMSRVITLKNAELDL